MCNLKMHHIVRIPLINRIMKVWDNRKWNNRETIKWNLLDRILETNRS